MKTEADDVLLAAAVVFCVRYPESGFFNAATANQVDAERMSICIDDVQNALGFARKLQREERGE